MHDIAHLKNSVDLREWVERDLNAPVVSRGSNAWTFKCPFHGETHGASLAVYKNNWQCWGACKIGGDLFDWIAHRHSLDIKRDFARIVQIAGGSIDNFPTGLRLVTLKPVSDNRQVSTQPPSLEWQAAGRTLLESAQHMLWSNGGRVARQYLSTGRGLTEDTIRAAQMGYVAQSDLKWQECDGMLVPSHSILIPWLADGVLWGIKCRRLDTDKPRYAQVSAAKNFKEHLGEGNLSSALYWADHIRTDVPLFVVEGEFNCLSVWQEAGQLVSPVSVGTSGQSIDPRWLMSLLSVPSILGWFDHDPAGQKGAERLTEFSSRVHMVALPQGTEKDINDLLRSDTGAVKHWVETLVAPFPEVPFMPPPTFPTAFPALASALPLFSEDICRAADGSWSFEWVDKYFDRFPNKQAAQVDACEWVRASISGEQTQKFTEWQAASSGECPVSLPLYHALTRGMRLNALDDQLTRIGMDFMAEYDDYATKYSYAVRNARCKRLSHPVKQMLATSAAGENPSTEAVASVMPEAKPVNSVNPPIQCTVPSVSQR